MAWVVSESCDIDLDTAAALGERLNGDWVWLDSAIGDRDRGRRSMVCLVTENVVELWPQHGVIRDREGRPTVVATAQLLATADRAFAADTRRLGPEAPGWVGYAAWEAAFAADAAFGPPSLDVPYPLLRFDRVTVALIDDGDGRRLVAVGADEASAAALLRHWRACFESEREVDAAADDVRVAGDEDLARHGDAIENIVEQIASGRVFQACYTFPIFTHRPSSFRRTYVRLRKINPGDYGAALRLGDLEVACVSPERFVEVESGIVVARPMKGTRKREGTNVTGAAELAASEKDRAENVMIVDLMRNDLGRVCEVGSVEVPSLFDVETYETVHQMTSTVRGRLRPNVLPFALLAAIFPPGSMSGAPKVEACRLLGELEREPRGIYGGTIGWLRHDGHWVFNVVIRTLQAWGDRARWDVGGGITAMSNATAELDEALAKARPIFALTGRAERNRPGLP